MSAKKKDKLRKLASGGYGPGLEAATIAQAILKGAHSLDRSVVDVPEAAEESGPVAVFDGTATNIPRQQHVQLPKLPSYAKAKRSAPKLPASWVSRRAGKPTAKANRTMRRAVGYLRYSSREQDPYSLQRQLEAISMYAEYNGYNIVRWYFDDQTSGAFVANRPGCIQMLQDAAEDVFDIVIVQEGTRAARKLDAMLQIFRPLNQLGKEIHSEKRGRWSKRDAHFEGVIAEENWDFLIEILRAGRQALIGQGRWPGPAPFGFEKVKGRPGQLKKVPEKFAGVEKMFEYLREHDPEIVADKLIAGEYPAPPSGWSAYNVRRLAQNAIYRGALIFGIRKTEKYVTDDGQNHTRVRKAARDEWVEGENEAFAIEHPEWWDEVNDRLNADKKEYHSASPDFLVNGIVYCTCGAKLYQQWSRNKHTKPRLVCSQAGFRRRSPKLYENKKVCQPPSVLIENVEDVLIELITSTLREPNHVSEMQSGYTEWSDKRTRATDKKRGQLQKELAQAQADLLEAFDQRHTSGLNREDQHKLRTVISSRISDAENGLANLPASTVLRSLDPTAVDLLSRTLCNLVPGRELPKDDPEMRELASIIRKLLPRVEVSVNRGKAVLTVRITGPLANMVQHGTNDDAVIEMIRPYAPRKGPAPGGLTLLPSAAKNVISPSLWKLIKPVCQEAESYLEKGSPRIRETVSAILFQIRTGMAVGHVARAFEYPGNLRRDMRRLHAVKQWEAIVEALRQHSPSLIRGLKTRYSDEKQAARAFKRDEIDSFRSHDDGLVAAMSEELRNGDGRLKRAELGRRLQKSGYLKGHRHPTIAIKKVMKKFPDVFRQDRFHTWLTASEQPKAARSARTAHRGARALGAPLSANP